MSVSRRVASSIKRKGLTVDSVDVLFEDHPVPLPLHLGHSDVDVDFLLGEERVLDVGLDSSEEERSEDLVKLLDDGVLVVVAPHLEPGVEVLAAKVGGGGETRISSGVASRSAREGETDLDEKTSANPDERGSATRARSIPTTSGATYQEE